MVRRSKQGVKQILPRKSFPRRQMVFAVKVTQYSRGHGTGTSYGTMQYTHNVNVGMGHYLPSRVSLDYAL